MSRKSKLIQLAKSPGASLVLQFGDNLGKTELMSASIMTPCNNGAVASESVDDMSTLKEIMRMFDTLNAGEQVAVFSR